MCDDAQHDGFATIQEVSVKYLQVLPLFRLWPGRESDLLDHCKSHKTFE